MEALATYLIKSSVWLTGFALIYVLFLRNERFFVLNRIYLVSGILISIIFPLFTWHYTVVLPVVPTAEVFEPQAQGIAEVSEPFPIQNVLLLSLYIFGISYLVFRIFRQTLPVFRVIRKSEIQSFRSAKLIRTAEYPASFSFFSFVFVNPSTDEIETREIVNHELEHIRQQHWIDLLLFEILRTVQWFNPAIWLYGHLIRQNHEYLADERALQRSSNPAIYRAALLNQMFGGPVISLANSFNYSLNKKRFTMMKHTISSPIRKLKLLLILPLIAGVFYAFAAPEYKFIQAEELATNVIQKEKTIIGIVSDENGKPLKSASVVILGKVVGTITDGIGIFILKVTDDTPIVISSVGFQTVKIKPDFEKRMQITMKTVGIEAMGNKITDAKSIQINAQTTEWQEGSLVAKNIEDQNNSQSIFKKTNSAGKPLLFIVDGAETSYEDANKIEVKTLESVDGLSGEASKALYGKKGENGVTVIKTNKGIFEQERKQTDVPAIGYGKMQKESTSDQSNAGFRFWSAGTETQPLLVIDGVINKYQNVNNILPETIESISILKNESATSLYGEKGKNGVIFIVTKKGISETENNPDEIKVTEFGKYQKKDESFILSPTANFHLKNAVDARYQPLFVLDGVIAPHGKVDPQDLESIEVLKGESATILYGEKGKNGVILIKTKKEASASQTGTTEVKVTGYAKDQMGNKANSGIQIRSTGTLGAENKPLIVIDGVIAENQNMDKIDPETIQSVNVLKDESAINKYGDKGKNGVIEITTKKPSNVFTMVEEMPQFPGGVEALKTYVAASMKYPNIALENGILGQVFVKFVVDKTGNVTNAKISRSVDPSLDKEALRIVNSLPKWTPGKQNGEAVDVAYEMPINFKMPADYRPKSREKLKAGTPSKIGKISWVNNTVYNSGNLTEVLGMQKGDKFSHENIKRRIHNEVIGMYLDKGYLFSNIQITEIPQNDGVVDLVFTLFEGNRGKIGKIDIKGNKNISTKDILDKIKIKPGDLFSKTKIIESVRALSKMGKFDPEKIHPEVIPESKNANREFVNVNLIFNLTEK